MIRRVFPLLILLGFVAAPLAAQAGAGDRSPAIAPAEAQAPTTSPAAGVSAAPEGPAFAERAQQPRTMQAYWHVFIAFAVTLLLLFGYAVSIGRRWARLEQEVLRLRGEVGG